MNIFELVYFGTLSTSAAFCFTFRQPEAFQRAFVFGAGGFLTFYALMLTIAGIRHIARRGTDPPSVEDRSESILALRVSRGCLALSLLALVASLCLLFAYPVLSGIAALLGVFVALFGCQRDQKAAFMCLGVSVLSSIVAHIYFRLHAPQ